MAADPLIRGELKQMAALAGDFGLRPESPGQIGDWGKL